MSTATQKSVGSHNGTNKLKKDDDKQDTRVSAFHHAVSRIITPVMNDLHFMSAFLGDARRLELQPNSIDLVVTSPPYWHKRDYKILGQIGRERNPDHYVNALLTALREWRRVLRPTGSVFLNIGDTYSNRSLIDIPGRLVVAARGDGWIIRNKIIWAKDNGVPEPAKNRLAPRHEYIIHMTVGRRYY